MKLPLIIANWKMNKTSDEVTDFAHVFAAKLKELGNVAEIALAPQAIHLDALIPKFPSGRVVFAGQNCGPKDFGAFTGEVSPRCLKEAGAKYVIIGHSERRWVFHEKDVLLTSRLEAAWTSDLVPVFCVGERLEDRTSGKTYEVLESQLAVLKGMKIAQVSQLVVAYEPVWAIGTGETATAAQAQQAHAFIRKWLTQHFSSTGKAVRLLYGGSVKATNARELLCQEDVDGLLVGGASLDPLGFAELVRNGVGSNV